MGGKCFLGPGPQGEPGLHVPRMNPAVYSMVKRFYTTTLREKHFDMVEVPTEAPEKPSHGDVDILAFGPKSDDMRRVYSAAPEAITKKLTECLKPQFQAVRHEHHPSNSVVSFAIQFALLPLPPWLTCSLSVEQKTSFQHSLKMLIAEDAHFQIDLHVCPSLSNFNYTIFSMAHGDTANIIALATRKTGLTFVPKGLALNLDHELPKQHGKPVRIILSDDVTTILDFLGLDEAAWRRGFTEQDDVFAWIAAGRLFQRITNERNTEKKKARTRAMFGKFVSEWLPENPNVGMQPPIDRKVLLQEALDRFEKRDEYDALIDKHNASLKEQEFWSKARGVVETSGQARTLRALHRWVDIANAGGESSCEHEHARKRPVIRQEAELNENLQPMWTVDSGMTESEMIKWIKANWETVRLLEKNRAEDARMQRNFKNDRRSGKE